MSNTACWKEAQKFLVGGVNSPVRSFRAVGGDPFFVDRGKGPFLWDVEGKRYLDYVCSWGALILGHRPEPVIRAVKQALERGTTFGTPTPLETELAKEISNAVPSMERLRFVSSGTEAAMSALRVARGATGRRKILKFDGAYHGHSDALLAKAGSGLATLGLPASAGVPAAVTEHTITVPFNDEAAVERAVEKHKKDLACIIVEPVMANVGLIPPKPGFLKFLRQVTKKAGAVLIFDEVITGFRVARGGAQALYGVAPDLTILGKVIGGGFPIGAYGGRESLMRHVAPAGPVYQAGTLSGHPVAMAAGIATLKELKKPGIYVRLDEKGRELADGLLHMCRARKIPAVVHQVGSLLTLFFAGGPVENADHARTSDTRRYARWFRGMLERGVYLPPSAFEALFISAAHGEKDLKLTLAAHRAVLANL
jgi:glutamate-1-semialdehyde 2,1-aminomutase